jgi:hypothetical protein
MSSQGRSFRWLHELAEHLATCLLIAVVLHALNPHGAPTWDRLPPGDSGELIMAAVSLTPPHPPGYPLYMWLYHGATRWMSYLNNSISATAVCAVLTYTLGVVGWSVLSHVAVGSYCSLAHTFAYRRMCKRVCVRVTFVALSWRCSPNSVRDVLTQTEVFGLHWCLVAMLTLCATSGGWTRFVLQAVLCGCNQHVAVFAVVPLSIACWCRCQPTRLHLLLSGIVGCAALTAMYTSLVMMNTHDLYAWGDLTTFTAVLRHMFRAEYGTLRLHSGRGILNATEWTDANTVFWRWAFERSGAALLFFLLASVGCIGPLVSRLCATFNTSASVDYDLTAVSWSCSVALACWAVAGSIGAFNVMVNLPLDADVAAMTVAGALHYQVVGRLWAHVWIPLSLLAAEGVHWAGHRVPAGRGLGSWIAITAVLVAACASVLSVPTLLPDPAVVPLRYMHQLRSVHDAYAESLLRGLPHGAIAVTSGDVAITALRHAQRARQSRPDVVHIDRETSWYAWFHRRLAEQSNGASKQIAWPKATNHSGPRAESDDAKNGFVSIVALAQLNAGVQKRRLFVMEDKELATEGPKLKELFSLRFGDNGWLYEVARRQTSTSKGRCSRTACRADQVPLLPRGLRMFECLVLYSNVSWRWSDVSKTCYDGNASDTVHHDNIFLLQSDVRLVARRFPWEALVLQQYHLGVKHALLQAADTAQHCCANKTMFAGALSVIRKEAVDRLRAEYFVDDETYTSSIAPFLSLLNSTLEAITTLL